MPTETDAGEWATVSDLSEYAYCPRALYYRRHPDDAQLAPGSALRSARGTRFHEVGLSAVERREAQGAGPAAVALLIGLAIVAALLLLGVL